VINPRRVIWCGDVIRVRLGDIVPADARLLEGDAVEVDQSANRRVLPATRKSGDAVFRFDHSSRRIGALVYATGANTYFGKTAQLVRRRTQSPFSTRGAEDWQLSDHSRVVL